MTAFDLAWSLVKNRAHESATEDHAREGGRDDYDDGVSLEEGMKSWDHDPKLLAAYKSGYNFASKGVKKADGTVTSGTPGTYNPMHSRPSGYESGGIFDPTNKKRKKGKKRPIGDKRRQQEIKPDVPRLLAENKRKLGDVIQNSTTNLLYALGLFTK